MSLRLGIAGLGTAGAAMLSAAVRRSDVEVTALADPALDALRVPAIDGARRYASLLQMLEDCRLDAVHIATPTPLHLEHVTQALEAGRHVIVEKPVTCDSEGALRLAEAAERGDRAVLVGHSESFEPYVAAARRQLDDGEIGDPVMIVAEKFTDWMRRPRLPEEWEPELGGGLIRRQGVHQVDVVRTLADREYDVRIARTRPDPERGAAGSYCAWLGADAGPDAFVAHDGIGRLSGGEPPPAAESGEHAEVDKRARSRRLLARALDAAGPLELGSGDRGRVLVLGTDGELTASPGRVEVTGRHGRRAVSLEGCPSGRDAVLDELLGAITGRRPVRHSLVWGAENLRLCEEIEQAAESNRPAPMKGAR